jgi:hypothetical protein
VELTGVTLSDMHTDHSQHSELTAVEVRNHLAALEAERALAIDTGVAEVAAYMADLDEEIEHCRQLYVAQAVTEIATLRAEMSGPQLG